MIKFTKMHGLGNDYIYISQINNENITAEEQLPSLARYLSNRHFGVGGDGIILIEKSKIADFKMRIFNSDGSEAQMCGNGIRCFAKYVYEKGLTNKTNIAIETKAGIKYANLKIKQDIVESVTIDMGKPIFEKEEIPVITDIKQQEENEKISNEKENNKLIKLKIKVLDKEFDAYPVSMGNPHAIIFVEDVDKFDVKKYGKEIENNSIFPEKTNVEFVQILGRKFIKMRVWERGSGETFACGTGACASLVISSILNKTERNATVLLKGGELKINWNEENNRVYMSGIATKVFEGEIDK